MFVVKCQDGMEWIAYNNRCEPCQKGWYNNMSSDSPNSCQKCADGTTNNGNHRTSCPIGML